MQKLKKPFKGFTLVELIIVITILAILATIAFISFQNYTKDARDGNRVATLTNLQKGLDLYAIKTGSYPIPNGNILTGSFNDIPLALAGNIGDEISRIVNMSTTPNDPISKNNYVYGVTENQQYYQIATILENLQTSSIISTTYANANQAYVVGNYKGLYKKGENTLYNLPSLIFTGSGNLISSGTYFVIDKGQNLPYKINNTSPSNTQTTTQVLKQLTGKDDLILTGVIVTEGDYKTFTGVLGYSEDAIGIARFGEKEYNEKISKNIGDNTDIPITPATCNEGEDGSSGVCKDPHWDKVVLMMHMDGDYNDYSNKNNNFTSIGGDTILTGAYYKYGTNALSINGGIPYTNASSDFYLNDNFTLEGWFHPIIGDHKYWISLGNNGNGCGFYIDQLATGKIQVYYKGVATQSNLTIPLNQWSHIVFQYDSVTNKYIIYINGMFDKEMIIPIIDLNYYGCTISRNLYIGFPLFSGSHQFNGYIDELRLTKGVARYTTGFTLPTQAFPNQ